MFSKTFNSVFCSFLTFQLAFAPAAFAGTKTEKVSRKPASETLNASDVQGKLDDLFSLQGNEGWEFQDQAGANVNVQNLIQSGAHEFKMVSRQENGKGLGIKLKLSPDSTENKFAMAIAVHDESFKKVYSRRMVTLDTTKPAVDSLVEIEQTIKSMESEVSASMGSAQFNLMNTLLPKANAAEPTPLRRALKVAYWGGIGIFALPFLLQLQVTFGSKKAAKVFYGVWFGSLAIAGIALTIDYIAHDKFPWKD